MDALTFATTLLGSLPQLIAGGAQILDLVNSGNAKLKQFADEKRNPTPEEWDALNASIDAKRAQLHS
jgi:uncharacterized protein involved in exopolysaccharide biosynthesis